MLKLPYHFSLFALADWAQARKSGLLLLPSSCGLTFHQEMNLLYQALYGYLSPQKCWKLSLEDCKNLGIENNPSVETTSLFAPIDHVDDLVFLLAFMEGRLSVSKGKANPLYRSLFLDNLGSQETLKWSDLPPKLQEHFFCNKAESILIAPDNPNEVRCLSPWLFFNGSRF